MKMCKLCHENERRTYFCKIRQTTRSHSLCRLCTNTQMRQYRAQNKEKMKQQSREQYYKNLTYYKEYYQRHKNKIISQQVDYHRERRQRDELFVFTERCRNLIRQSFKRKNFEKCFKTQDLLGIDIKQFKIHLETTFLDRYGYQTDWLGVEIDHIIPLGSVNSLEDVIKLNHYTNLQLLTKEDNRKKGVKSCY